MMEPRASEPRSTWWRMLIKSRMGSILAKVTALARLPRGWAAADCWPVASVCGGRAESRERPRRLVREERAASLRLAAAPPIDFSVNCVVTRKTHKYCISSQTFFGRRPPLCRRPFYFCLYLNISLRFDTEKAVSGNVWCGAASRKGGWNIYLSVQRIVGWLFLNRKLKDKYETHIISRRNVID